MQVFIKIFLILLMISVGYAATINNHVRVVLDTSMSMRISVGGNPAGDPGRLAILSTLLLHDLVRPNNTLGDSFEVIPFNLSWPRNWTAGSPLPISTRNKITALFRNRDDFARKLYALSYDSSMTYFYPGLKRAIEDLSATTGTGYDRKVIVMVTDGLPDHFEEVENIKTELLSQLGSENIQLYILAFGQVVADPANRAFFTEITSKHGGAYFDQSARDLLKVMADIFGQSFGYSVGNSQSLSSTSSLDLHNAENPKDVAVVVFTENAVQPNLKLEPPLGGRLNTPDPLRQGKEKGGGYALQWILKPDIGFYPITSNANKVIVLRPVDLKIAIKPDVPKTTQVIKTMAGKEFPIQIFITSVTGSTPPVVDVSYRLSGPREGSGYAWQTEPQPPTHSQLEKDGRIYYSNPIFPTNKEDPLQPYDAYIEVVAEKQGSTVATLEGNVAHRVEVYPFLDIRPNPLESAGVGQAINSGEKECYSFKLERNVGYLPAWHGDTYPIRAYYQVDKNYLNKELFLSQMTLDGKLILEKNQKIVAGGTPSPWTTGTVLTKEQLLGEHRFCVSLGQPRGVSGNNSAIPIAVHFILNVSPYDEEAFDVIKPFTAKILVNHSGIPAILWPLLLAGLLLAFWHSRYNPRIPEDLAYSVTPFVNTSENLTLSSPVKVEKSPLWKQFLAISPVFPIAAKHGEHLLGKIKPTHKNLYELHLIGKASIENEQGEKVEQNGWRNTVNIEVYHKYKLKTPHGSYMFRIEYLEGGME